MTSDPRWFAEHERQENMRQERIDNIRGAQERRDMAAKPMVELVALAIEATMFAPHEMPLSDALHAKYLGTARAAIEAMREPTFDPDKVSYHQGMTRADWWRAMIDEALR